MLHEGEGGEPQIEGRFATPLGSGESKLNNMEVQDSRSVCYDTFVTLRSNNMSPSPLFLDNALASPPNQVSQQYPASDRLHVC